MNALPRRGACRVMERLQQRRRNPLAVIGAAKTKDATPRLLALSSHPGQLKLGLLHMNDGHLDVMPCIEQVTVWTLIYLRPSKPSA